MNKKVYVVLISGGTGSGKTTLAKTICKKISKSKSLSLLPIDNYYKNVSELDFEERKKINYDHPNAIDSELLISDIKKLCAGESINSPIYDFTTHSRSEVYREVSSSDIIIIEGIFALHFEKLRNLANIKIFIKTDDDLRFIRRMQRDLSYRKRDLDSIINQYLQQVKPMHNIFVEPTIDFADLIVPCNEVNEVATDILITKINSLLKEE